MLIIQTLRLTHTRLSKLQPRGSDTSCSCMFGATALRRACTGVFPHSPHVHSPPRAMAHPSCTPCLLACVEDMVVCVNFLMPRAASLPLPSQVPVHSLTTCSDRVSSQVFHQVGRSAAEQGQDLNDSVLEQAQARAGKLPFLTRWCCAAAVTYRYRCAVFKVEPR
jgi:hypothetical protein